MDCREVEMVIIELVDHPIASEAQLELDAHLETCPSCRRFAAGYLEIKRSIAAMETPQPPLILLERTRRLCYDGLKFSHVQQQNSAEEKIPKLILLAFIGTLIIGIGWAIATIINFITTRIISQQFVILIWIVIIHNLIIFMAVPLLLGASKAYNLSLNVDQFSNITNR